MSTIKRVWFAIRVNIAMGLAAIIHFRIGVDYLYPMGATQHPGPFSTYAGALENIVPVAIALAILASWAWVVYGSVQEEQRRALQPRP